MLPDPEFLAVFRLVLDRVQVGDDVDDFAAEVVGVWLLDFVSIVDGFGGEGGWERNSHTCF